MNADAMHHDYCIILNASIPVRRSFPQGDGVAFSTPERSIVGVAAHTVNAMTASASIEAKPKKGVLAGTC